MADEIDPYLEEDMKFRHIHVKIPNIIREHLDDWKDVSPEIALEVKKAFVELFPELAPVETLRMLMGIDPYSAGPNDNEKGYSAKFLDREIFEVSITPDKEQIWLVECTSQFSAGKEEL